MLVTVILLIGCFIVSGSGPSVDLRWSDVSAQFLFAENLTDEEDGPSMVTLEPDESVTLRHPIQQRSAPQPARNFSCSTPLKGWELQRLLPQLEDSAYRIVVESAKEGSRFRVGMVPRKDIAPGFPFYREWMADSDGCWSASGVPDPSADMHEDPLWGSFGVDGWAKTDKIVMDFHPDVSALRFSSGESTPWIELSLDGFATIAPTLQGKMKEDTTMTSIKQTLLLNGVSFEFETANFGPDLPIGMTLQSILVPASPINACSPLPAEVAKLLRGAILFAVRGDCDFLDKVLHAQAAGAIAVIVGDNIPEASSKRKTANSKFDLVIMDQFDRDEDAVHVRIPSVFVSSTTRTFIETQLRTKERVTVSLRGAVYAPAHHGVHWREGGLVPAVWLSPGSKVSIKLLAIHDNTEDSDTAVCRPLAYTPLGISERRTLLSKIDFAGSKYEGALKAFSTPGAPRSPTKRLIVRGSLCLPREAVEKSWTLKQSWVAPFHSVSTILPWSIEKHGKSFPWYNHPMPPNRLPHIPSHVKSVRVGWTAASLDQLLPLLSASSQGSGSSAWHLERVESCAMSSSIEFVQAFKAYHLSYKPATALQRVCIFKFSIQDEVSQVEVPAWDLFGSGFRGPGRYFWQVNMREASQLGVVGITVSPLAKGEKLLWGLSTMGSLIAGGVVLSPKGLVDQSLYRWDDYVAILLDVAAAKLTFFTCPNHSRWVTFKFDIHTGSLLQPTLSDIFFPTAIDNIASESGVKIARVGSSSQTAGYVPFVAMSGGSVHLSEVFPANYADRMHFDQQAMLQQKTCQALAKDVTLCS